MSSLERMKPNNKAAEELMYFKPYGICGLL